MNLAVMGAGYVGLTTAICLASQNHRITIFDIDNEKIKQIQNKKLPFFENGLQTFDPVINFLVHCILKIFSATFEPPETS